MIKLLHRTFSLGKKSGFRITLKEDSVKAEGIDCAVVSQKSYQMNQIKPLSEDEQEAFTAQNSINPESSLSLSPSAWWTVG